MKLQRFIPPPPIPPPVCVSCATMAPDCIVPVGEGAELACWYCAHQIAEHGRPVESAYSAICGCCEESVYPPDVLERRRALRHSAGEHATRAETPGSE